MKNKLAELLAEREILPERLAELERRPFLELPKKIVDNLPQEKLAEIRRAISDMTEDWKRANAIPDAEGFVSVPMGTDLYHWNNPKRIKFDACPAWRIGITQGFTSPMSLLSDLYFDQGGVLEKRVKLLMFHEYFAVAITDHGLSAPLDELARYLAWTANSLVSWLIQLRGNLGWEGVEPVASIYQACYEDKQREVVAKIKETRDKQLEKFINQKVTDDEILWIKSEGQRMKQENKNLKRWTIAGKLSEKLQWKILQKQVDNYLKDAGM